MDNVHRFHSARRPWVLAENQCVRVYRCGACGDNHVEVGTISLRFNNEGLEGFHHCLTCLATAKPPTINANVRRRAHAFTFAGLPCQILLSTRELRSVINALDGALSTLNKLNIGCTCYRNN